MAENTTFTASGEEVITRSIEVQKEGPSPESEQEFLDYFEIERTSHEIANGGYRRIALQFPDELLHESVPIFCSLKSRLGPENELYVLADTSYGSCCVDEVAAQHIDADVMVHYGHACLSQTSRLPVIYVFGRKPIHPLDCSERLVECLGSTQAQHETVLLRCDVAYTYAADQILANLRVALPSTTVLFTPLPLKVDPVKPTTNDVSLTPRPSAHPTTPLSTDVTPAAAPDSTTSAPISPSTSSSPPISAPTSASVSDSAPNEAASEQLGPVKDPSVVLYVGGESLGLTNLLMTHSSCKVYSYDPASKATRLESAKTNKLLMRRYAVVQKARDADVFGILVGTLGVASYLPLISHIRTILKRAQKKSYTISVGKLNPAKLANFLEIECFVIVACPENSVIEAKEFLRPIVTPYELEIALQPEPIWTGKYVLDFKEVLSSSTSPSREGQGGDEETEPVDMDRPMFSLVTGKYRHAKRYASAQDQSAAPTTMEGGEKEGTSSAVALRNQETALFLAESASAQFLQTRTYQGLETRLGQDLPSVLEQGRSGIARGYQDDHPN